MKVEFDLENSCLNDWISEDDQGTLTFTEVFKDELMSSVANRFKYDSELQSVVRQHMISQLHPFLVGYKDEAVIKGIVEDIVRKDLNGCGTPYLRPAHEQLIREKVEEHLSIALKELRSVIIIEIKAQIHTVIGDLIENGKLSQFIDKNLLTEFILTTLSKAGVSNNA